MGANDAVTATESSEDSHFFGRPAPADPGEDSGGRPDTPDPADTQAAEPAATATVPDAKEPSLVELPARPEHRDKPAGPATRARGRKTVAAGVAGLLVGVLAGGTAGYVFVSRSTGAPAIPTSAGDAGSPSPAGAGPAEGTIESAAATVGKSVMVLRATGASGSAEGSGMVIGADGLILTNNHVVEDSAQGAGTITATTSTGQTATATIVGRDPTADIAVVRASSLTGLIPVRFAKPDALRVGQTVLAIGAPYALTSTVTSGIVSALKRPVRAGSAGGAETVMSAIQTDAALNPGNSGGPLANLAGEIVGINSAIYTPPAPAGTSVKTDASSIGIGFAIPIEQAKRIADELVRSGTSTQAVLGASAVDTPQGEVRIGDVVPGGPADAAGLRAGDVVTKFGTDLIGGADGLLAAVRSRAAGDSVQLTLGDQRVITVVLGGKVTRSGT